ncbi:exported hypothetical protein [Candidatus Magnetomoraceae bacterium gMMP-1]
MKKKSIYLFIFIVAVFFTLSAQADQVVEPSTVFPMTEMKESQGTTPFVPCAFMADTEYKFDSIIEGTDVVHDFIIKNTGQAALHINKVRTG